jgi:guanidinopropionase
LLASSFPLAKSQVRPKASNVAMQSRIFGIAARRIVAAGAGTILVRGTIGALRSSTAIMDAAADIREGDGMDKKKLDALRRKYEGAKGGDIFDPEFAAVGQQVFSGGARRKWPFADPATLLGAPFRPEAPSLPDFGGLEVALIGVPMDLGVTNRAGARHGPRAVRAVERIGPYEHALRIAPAAQVAAADVGDVPMQSRFSLDQCHADIEAFFTRVCAAGVVPLSVGGDHSITLPILKALGRDRPVGLVHIDAHCDSAGEFEGTKFHHGGPFRLAVLAGVLDPERTIQIGIRGGAEFLWEFSYESGMTVLHDEDVAAMGVPAVVAKAREVVGDGPVYVSFDVDALDPGFAPGTGTPEAGGLSPREALGILRGLAGLDVVGGDVVEVAPQYDATTNTAQIGAQCLFELLCLVALRRRQQCKSGSAARKT